MSEAVSNGRTRSEARLEAVRTWQESYYAGLPRVEDSRQVKRRISRYIKGRTIAQAKDIAIKNRRKK